jgi:hypothetical protein
MRLRMARPALRAPLMGILRPYSQTPAVAKVSFRDAGYSGFEMACEVVCVSAASSSQSLPYTHCERS